MLAWGLASWSTGLALLAVVVALWALVRVRAHHRRATDLARLVEHLRAEIANQRRGARHLACHDTLTGLPNRALFLEHLKVALTQRRAARTAVFVVDVDRFSEINDSLGHAAGDVLLQSIGGRLDRALRQGDTVGRLGGDELTILIRKLHHETDATKLADKLLAVVREPYLVQGRELFVTASIGISLAPDHGSDPDTLVRNADAAMHGAQQRGGDGWELYTEALNERAVKRLDLENRLHRAVHAQQFAVHYQPIVDLKSGQIVAAEALLRWPHPDLGLLLPLDFVDTAEMCGLITPIGSWVLHEACRQARAWQGGSLSELSVSVNLSARQLGNPELLNDVESALTESGLSPDRLELEITESSAMRDAETSLNILIGLRRLGVRLAIDDFGTGYSSWLYLKRFPVQCLKLDQAFVRDLSREPITAAIVDAMIHMSHEIGLSVVAEGIESQAQLDFLVSRGCDRGQGHFFSRALPATEFESLLGQTWKPERQGPSEDSAAGAR